MSEYRAKCLGKWDQVVGSITVEVQMDPHG